MAKWMQRFIIAWWPLVTATAWALMITGLVFFGLLMADLAKAIQGLSGDMKAIRSYSLTIEKSISALYRITADTDARVKAQEVRLESLERRISSMKAGGSSKDTGTVYIREYIIRPDDSKERHATENRRVLE